MGTHKYRVQPYKILSGGENNLSLPGIEPRFFGPPARSPVSILHYATLI
jgi:hypothetical protein